MTVTNVTDGGTAIRAVCLDCDWTSRHHVIAEPALRVVGHDHVHAFPTHAVFLFETSISLIHAALRPEDQPNGSQ